MTIKFPSEATPVTPPPTCTRCSRPARYCRAPHSAGWHLAAWCPACHAHADPKRLWLPRRAFTPDELAALPVLTEIDTDVDHRQLNLLDDRS